MNCLKIELKSLKKLIFKNVKKGLTNKFSGAILAKHAEESEGKNLTESYRISVQNLDN